MKKTLNYTGRGKLSADKLCPGLASKNGEVVFHWSGDFGDIPSTAKWAVYVHVFVKNYFHRERVAGTGSDPVTEVRLEGLALAALTEGERIRAKFNLVDESGTVGLILKQWEDQISGPSEPDGSGEESLLRLRTTASLGDVPWEIDLDGGSWLCLNPKFPNFKAKLLHDPLVRSLVLPTAVRTVLTHCFTSGAEESWEKAWLAWTQTYVDSEAPIPGNLELGSAQVKWIAEVVASFCQKQGFLKKLLLSGEQ